MSLPDNHVPLPDGDYKSPHRYAMVLGGTLFLDGLHRISQEQVDEYGPWERLVSLNEANDSYDLGLRVAADLVRSKGRPTMTGENSTDWLAEEIMEKVKKR